MSILSNHFPEIIDELNADPDRPADPEPTEAEVTAMGEAAGQLLCCDGSPILEILPEDPPAPCRHVAAPTDARRARRPRQKPARSITVLSAPTSTNPATFVRIDLMHSTARSVKVESFWYWITPLEADFGRAFLVEQSVANRNTDPARGSYHVNLGGAGHHPSCECPGFLRWGHQHDGRTCKHLDGIRALMGRGKL